MSALRCPCGAFISRKPSRVYSEITREGWLGSLPRDITEVLTTTEYSKCAKCSDETVLSRERETS